jgi:GTP1/Obg family GTP-binding protein
MSLTRLYTLFGDFLSEFNQMEEKEDETLFTRDARVYMSEHTRYLQDIQAVEGLDDDIVEDWIAKVPFINEIEPFYNDRGTFSKGGISYKYSIKINKCPNDMVRIHYESMQAR